MKRTILVASTAALLLAIGAACSTSRASAPATPKPPVTVDPEPFEGTTWQLIELRGNVALPGRNSEPPYAMFQADVASVRGHGGVNSFFGPYVKDGTTLRIERLASTRMAGPTELMDQESALLTALQSARSWRVTGDVLELFDARGAMLARFRAGAPSTAAR